MDPYLQMLRLNVMNLINCLISARNSMILSKL